MTKNEFKIPLEDQKKIWLWVHASDCFEHAKDLLDEILKTDPKLNLKKYKSL